MSKDDYKTDVESSRKNTKSVENRDGSISKKMIYPYKKSSSNIRWVEQDNGDWVAERISNYK